jgi:uncharacterized membrane protein
MSKLIVYTYNTEDKAAEVLRNLSGMKQENVQRPLIALEDAAVVVKNAKGKVRVRQTLESVAKGSNVTSGGFWGLLIGFLFGGPLLGALLGMGMSALFGRNIDLGIDNAFIKGVGDELAPGDSALFILVGDTPIETVAEALNPFGGNLYHTNLSAEATTALTEASEHQSIAEAIESEITA